MQNSTLPWCYNCKYAFYIKGKCKHLSSCNESYKSKKEAYKKFKYAIGDRVKFKSEKRPYKIQACNENYIICTKPYNPKKTFMYVIVDFKNCIRGADNWYCKFNYANPIEAAEALKELEAGIMEVSRRNFVQLDIESIKWG